MSAKPQADFHHKLKSLISCLHTDTCFTVLRLVDPVLHRTERLDARASLEPEETQTEIIKTELTESDISLGTER